MFNRVAAFLLIVFNGILIYQLVWTQQGLFHYFKLKEIQKNLQKKVERLKEDNIELSRKIRLLKNDPSYLETQIRIELRFVQEEEILYLRTRDNQDQNSTLLH